MINLMWYISLLDILLIILIDYITSFFKRKNKISKLSKINNAVDIKSYLYAKYIYFGNNAGSYCIGREVKSAPGPTIETNKGNCINFGSYNYLGYGGAHNKDYLSSKTSYNCSIDEMGVSTETEILSKKMASFIGKDKCLIFPIGWDTNFSVISIIIDNQTLVLSDEYNHSSIVCGCRSGNPKKILVYKNNNINDARNVLFEHLNKCIELNITYSKILIIAEGLYSMDGTIINIKEFIDLKNMLPNTYLYIDEAHSIGSIGNKGRGVCYMGENENDWKYNVDNVDILMGTFTKSFGSIGGYICANENIINYISINNKTYLDDIQLAPLYANHISGVLDELTENSHRIIKLRNNTHYLRDKLNGLGIKTMGTYDSPVIPILTYTISRTTFVSNVCHNNGCALVVAGFPATKLNQSRIRICISSSHTFDQLDKLCLLLEKTMKLSFTNILGSYFFGLYESK